jgi:hypothetical protein
VFHTTGPGIDWLWSTFDRSDVRYRMMQLATARHKIKGKQDQKFGLKSCGMVRFVVFDQLQDWTFKAY